MLNKAQVIGHLGADPKVSVGRVSGAKVASFSVATTEKGYTKQDGTVVPDRTEWHNVVCFGKLAEIVERFIHKGSKVYIEGKMRTRSYEGQDHVKRNIMEINADAMEMLDPKPAAGQQPQPQQQPYAQPSPYATAPQQPQYQASPLPPDPAPLYEQPDLPF